MSNEGMLKHMVLRKLAHKPSSGYALCKEIGNCSGHKPSYGSIYPLLEHLSAEGMVSVHDEGRKKVYALTTKGRTAEHNATKHIAQLISEEQVRIKKLMSILEVDPAPMLAILERARKGEAPLGKVSHNMFHFRDTVFRMVQEGSADRNATKINALLVDMIKKLERMK